MSDIAPTPEEIKEMTGKSVECDECGQRSFRVKSGVYSNQCRHCGAKLDINWNGSD